jgi:hypothetical protein
MAVAQIRVPNFPHDNQPIFRKCHFRSLPYSLVDDFCLAYVDRFEIHASLARRNQGEDRCSPEFH